MSPAGGVLFLAEKRAPHAYNPRALATRAAVIGWKNINHDPRTRIRATTTDI